LIINGSVNQREIFNLEKLSIVLDTPNIKQNATINLDLVKVYLNNILSDIILTSEEIDSLDQLSRILSVDRTEIFSVLTNEVTPHINEIKNNIFIEVDKKFDLIKKYYSLLSKENIKFNIDDLFFVINKVNQYKHLQNENYVSIKAALNNASTDNTDLYFCFDLEFGKLKRIDGYDRVELKPARIYFTSKSLMIHFKYTFSEYLSGETNFVNICDIKTLEINTFNNTGQSYISYTRKGDRKPWIISGFKEPIELELVYKFINNNSIKEEFKFETTDSKDKSNNLDRKQDTNNSNMSEISPLKELENLIGLNTVKQEIYSLINLIKAQNLRKKQGLKIVDVSFHSVFTGSPGTGKTTVARLYASILKDLGVLRKGHLIEVDRTELVAGYLGQTAMKVDEVVNKALDGVLFIDEAYGLIGKNGDSYGEEAINTLLKRMEDDRSRLVVIVAGYTDKMEEFINSNPGLKSRFNRFIEFPDYDANDLLQIFSKMIETNQYKLSDNARIKLLELIKSHTEVKDKNFGNGRYVRNIFEMTIQNQANALSKKNKIEEEDLILILDEHVPNID